MRGFLSVIAVLSLACLLISGTGCSKGKDLELPASQEKLELSGSLKNGVREIEVKASRYQFNPSSLVVNEGEKLKLILTSNDVSHGFYLPDFGINAVMPVGETKVVELVADKVGTFRFQCSVYCGSGHPRMRGELIVREK